MQESGGKQRARLTGFVAVAFASFVMFAALGGVGLAQTAVGLGQYQYGKKVTICHKGKRTIRISVRAWPAHKRHGDSVGTCEQAAKRAHAKKKHAKIAVTHGKKAEQGKAGKKAEQGKAGKEKSEGSTSS
ncbi:MAG: hypothetical protein LH654_10530, partial [Thermoleophilia bacterium]|nr:hypothetical protein [Thermoleophilia bacterium]